MTSDNKIIIFAFGIFLGFTGMFFISFYIDNVRLMIFFGFIAIIGWITINTVLMKRE